MSPSVFVSFGHFNEPPPTLTQIHSLTVLDVRSLKSGSPKVKVLAELPPSAGWEGRIRLLAFLAASRSRPLSLAGGHLPFQSGSLGALILLSRFLPDSDPPASLS